MTKGTQKSSAFKAWKIATGKLVSLSEQQLVDCAKNGAVAKTDRPFNRVGIGAGGSDLPVVGSMDGKRMEFSKWLRLLQEGVT